METVKRSAKPITRRTRWPIACAAALALGLPVVTPHAARAHGGQDMPPNVPPSLQVPAGNQVFFWAHASGVQIYSCTATGWTFVAPSATLFDEVKKMFRGEREERVAIHFTGPTWQANDGSTVTGKKIASVNAPSPTAIPWLLLSAVITTTGPDGGDTLTDTTYVQRLDTTGGVAPADGCDAAHIGAYAGVPYTADYFFYKAE